MTRSNKLQRSEREILRTELSELSWKLLNEKSAPALLHLLRESAEAMQRAHRLLANPLHNEIDHLTAIALFFQGVKRTSVDSQREWYVDDSQTFDQCANLFSQLYYIDDD